jgi:hypothetical protein
MRESANNYHVSRFSVMRLLLTYLKTFMIEAKTMKKSLTILTIASVISLSFCPLTYPASAQKMVMAALMTEDSPSGRFVRNIYAEAFRRLGIEFEYRYYPAVRASAAADNGEVNGELTRVYSYGDAHPNLIRVEEPAFHTAFAAFGTDPAIQLTGWDSLRDTQYTVAYLRGDRRSHDKLTEAVPPERLTATDSVPDGLKILMMSRTDLYVGPEMIVRQSLQSEELRQFTRKRKVSDIRVAGVMEKISLHAYLHKKHQELGPRLSAVLKVMREEGLIEKYQAMAEEGQ